MTDLPQRPDGICPGVSGSKPRTWYISSGLRASLLASVALHSMLLAWPAHMPGSSLGSANRPIALTAELRPRLPRVPAAAPGSVVSVPPLSTEVAPETPAKTPELNPYPLAAAVATNHGIAPPYFSLSDLTRLPEALTEFGFSIPSSAEHPGATRLELRLWLSSEGTVDRVDVIDGRLPESLRLAAAAAFRHMRFLPGEIHGVPVASQSAIIIEFKDTLSDEAVR